MQLLRMILNFAALLRYGITALQHYCKTPGKSNASKGTTHTTEGCSRGVCNGSPPLAECWLKDSTVVDRSSAVQCVRLLLLFHLPGSSLKDSEMEVKPLVSLDSGL